MSRVGKNPVVIPAGVKVNASDGAVSASGKLGSITVQHGSEVKVTLDGESLTVAPADASQSAQRMWGTLRARVQDAVTGVSSGFSRKLELIGVGYRAQLRGKDLVLQLGFSHEIVKTPLQGITFEVPDNNHIVVRGFDKQKVGQVCAEIKSLRPVEPYKGKGIRYEGEFVIRKEGKKK